MNGTAVIWEEAQRLTGKNGTVGARWRSRGH